MIRKSHIYWYCQIFGWSFYLIINFIFQGFTIRSNYKDYFLYFFLLLAGIFISHFYRLLVIRLNVLHLRVPYQLLFMAVFSFLKAGLFFLVALTLWIILDISIQDLTAVQISEFIINFTVVFCLWNVIYFGFQYFQNYKRAEISSLRYLAASRESELNNLKAQLNPHFIFNCMNSIRALIDENPVNAKAAVTRLSNILRTTLLFDKSKEIPLKEEMKLVQDYLDLEKIRHEERLEYRFSIAEEVSNCRIPPFIIQSQVENAIKHGISKNPGKGTILVAATFENNFLNITVSNTGKLTVQDSQTGVGFKNSTQRLELLYGSKASIKIEENLDMVIVKIIIPLTK